MNKLGRKRLRNFFGTILGAMKGSFLFFIVGVGRAAALNKMKCNFDELGEADFERCMCNKNTALIWPWVEGYQSDCRQCVRDGQSVWLVRGARFECAPCSSFPKKGDGRFFALHYVNDEYYCPWAFPMGRYGVNHIGCGNFGKKL